MNRSYIEFDAAGNLIGSGTLEDSVFEHDPQLVRVGIRIAIDSFAVMKCGGEGHHIYYVVGPKSTRGPLPGSKPIALQVDAPPKVKPHEVHRKRKAEITLPKGAVVAGRKVRIGHTATHPVKLIIDGLPQTGSALGRTPSKGDQVVFSAPGNYEVSIFDEYYYAEPVLIEAVIQNDARERN